MKIAHVLLVIVSMLATTGSAVGQAVAEVAEQAQPPAGQAAQSATGQQAPPPATQQARPPATAAQKPPAKTAPPSPAILQPPPPPVGYTIGPDDALSVLFWRDPDMSREVIVRPDGKISLPLINDIDAAGLTPDELRARITEAARKLFLDPNVTIIVRTINSRRIFVTGSVARPGPYPIADTMTVLQAIALAGGLTEYANTKNIAVLRTESGRSYRFKFNYKEVMEGKNLRQNIALKPGDTVIVP